MAPPMKPVRAALCWEGDSRDILREWPKNIRGDFGTALDAMSLDTVQTFSKDAIAAGFKI